MSSEFRVGIFFFISLVALLGFTVFVTDPKGADGDYEVVFRRVEGLRGGDPVTYNGVKVGRVSAVRPDIDGTGIPRVLVGFNVDEDNLTSIFINDATEFSIGQGLLGGFRLSILTMEAGGVAITPEILKGKIGENPVSLNTAIGNLSKILEENRENIRDAIDRLPGAVGNFSEMASEIRDVVKENREGIDAAVKNIAELADNANIVVKENRVGIKKAIDNFGDASEELKGMVAENRENIKKTVDQLPAAVASLTKTSDEIGAMVTENRDGVKTSIDNLAEFGPKLNKIGSNVETITDQIATGKGTIGRLIFEETLHEKAEDALTSFQQRLDEIKPFTSGISNLKFYIGAGADVNADTGANKGYAYLRIEPRPWKLYEFAVGYRGAPTDRDTASEDPDDLNVDITFLYGRRWFADDMNETYRLTGKVGFIESQLGGQLEWNLMPHKLDLVLMARKKSNDFDPDQRRFEEGSVMARAYFRYRVWKRVYLTAGIDDMVDDAAPYFGISAEILDNDLRNMSAASAISP